MYSIPIYILIALVLRQGRDIAYHTSPGCAQLAPLRLCRIVNLNPSVILLHRLRFAEVSQPDMGIEN